MIQAGSLLAKRFELEALLAEGALGQVWSATDNDTGIRVAVKLAPLDDDFAKGLFFREGQTLGRLKSAYLPELVDVRVDEETQQVVLATRMVDGEGLDAWQKHANTPEILRIYAEIARGLDDLHRAGVVHRDIKPSNVIVRSAGQPPICLLDLGFAVSEREPDTLTASATTVIGTPAYLSPEAILGRPLGSEADIFALGVMLFEVLTGQAPWPTAASMPQTLVNRLRDAADFSKLDGCAPQAVIGLVQSMLAQEPAARPTAPQVAEVLSQQTPAPKAPFLKTLGHAVGSSQAAGPVSAPAPPPPGGRPSPAFEDAPAAAVSADESLSPIPPPPITLAPPAPSLGGAPSSRTSAFDALPAGAPLKSRLAVGILATTALVGVAALGVIAYLAAVSNTGSSYSWQPALYAILGLGAGASLFYVYSKRKGKERSAQGNVNALAQRIQALEAGLSAQGGVIRAEDLEAAVQRSVIAALESRPVTDTGRALELLAKQLGAGDKKPSWDKRITTVTGVFAAVLAVVGASAGILGTFGVWSPNHPPIIRACGSEGMRATREKTMEMRVDALDSDNDPLIFSYTVDKGSIEGSNNLALLSVRAVSDKLVTVTVHVRDDKGESATRECPIRINVPPEVHLRLPPPSPAGTLVEVAVEGADSDGDALSTSWQSSCEGLSSTTGRAVFVKTAPAACRVIARISDTFDTVELGGTVQSAP